ncbi:MULTISPECIES: hypothetical protein [Vibrio]|uniref:Uncharacterized protein n=1 Tax=Vibrio tasmaniensis TaxID=212663 RepID=A0A2N7NCI0_9VIBR|nr:MULTISPECIES: hypothetical protein [Vibrio]MCC4791109.1 hypothetical protein [Vibrio splendidus]PMP09325.1 hypothetical protein BCS92_23940 [Vibrio tasmaniensis]TKG26450.1 hypothetical protein FC057_24410 [Vibrio tasmaniensis]TKG35632.1 hypothetical protein FC063_24705 [Vibrio tasmaniensis]TKG40564.1 hypothetical protein FC061_24270 [Vibrio tasmaniensis]
MFINWLKKYFSIEKRIESHPKFRDAFKIVGYVLAGDNTTMVEGVEAQYSKAVLILCVRDAQEYYQVWESEEYLYHEDALNVLKAECGRISEFIDKRIEICDFSSKTENHEVVDVYNENNRQYILESTNL